MGQTASIHISARAVIVQDNHILLNECHSEPGVYYTFPGGTVNAGEPSREALVREVHEEVGLTVAVGKLLLVCEYIPAGTKSSFRAAQSPRISLFFACTVRSDAECRGSACQPDWDQVGHRWLELDKLPQVTLLPDLANTILHAYRGDISDCFCQEQLPASWLAG